MKLLSKNFEMLTVLTLICEWKRYVEMSKRSHRVKIVYTYIDADKVNILSLYLRLLQLCIATNKFDTKMTCKKCKIAFVTFVYTDYVTQDYWQFLLVNVNLLY